MQKAASRPQFSRAIFPDEPSGPSLRETFADNLRALRRAKNLSQEELSARAGVSRTYVSSVERRERNIAIDNIGKLAHALGVTPSKLLDPELIKRLRDEIA
jgi:transcriptional regulator with XRE-family HTH domain